MLQCKTDISLWGRSTSVQTFRTEQIQVSCSNFETFFTTLTCWIVFIIRCTQCDKVYHAIHALRSHMKVHTETLEKRLLVCDICKKPFTSKVGLKRHLRWHTDGTKSENEQYNRFIAENFDMSCDHCETVFISFHDARRHYKEIHNEKKGYLKCCNIKLRELWILTDHISSHLNPSNFK